jgi:signal transduction histidine kinase
LSGDNGRSSNGASGLADGATTISDDVAITRALDAVRDPRRLEALRASGLLDSEVEEEFDRLTRLAARLLGAPATFFSLVDADRDFYKSCVGFDEPLSSARELRGVTFCHYSLVADGALVIPDTRADPVYRNVPTVESLGVAAYLGVPIRAPGGEVLGSFCAIDFTPKNWSQLEVDTMKELGKSAEREVAIRHWMRTQMQLVDRERNSRLELERVNESRAKLIRGFSHDVKNPLSTADGFLSLMQDGLMGELDETQLGVIGRIRKSIRTAVDLIDDMVEIARAEAGALEVRFEPIRVEALAMELTEEYRAQAESKGLSLHCEVADNVPYVISDEARVRQVLTNLISNAVKYTKVGSAVVRVAPREGPADEDALDGVAVDVVDTGDGIADEQRHLLFREFSRLDPAAADGVGLGLAISRRVAEALGGHLYVSPGSESGSTFTLWLPVRPHSEERTPQT